MRRYPVLLLFAINAVGLLVAWLAGVRLGWFAGAGIFVLTVGTMIALIAFLARLPGRGTRPD